MYLGIEIGGTKLQLGLGRGDGHLLGQWRGGVDVTAGGDGIRRQITAAVPELLATAGIERPALRGVGVGFGGPVDDATRSVVKSHQVAGWDGFPLADWVADLAGIPAVLGNDADVGGLGEALVGAGKGLSPVFYMTIGSGIGGGLIIDGEIYRGCGRGAAEIGHVRVGPDGDPLEHVASGWGIGRMVKDCLRAGEGRDSAVWRMCGGNAERADAVLLGRAATDGDPWAIGVLHVAQRALADALTHVITLLCPRRVVIGGGVSLIGEAFFGPLRNLVAERTFAPFAGLTDIVPAALGEAVVVHGALALARRKLGG